MKKLMYRILCWILSILLLFIYLTACQIDVPTSQVIGCSQQTLPLVQARVSVQASLQTVYVANGASLYAFNAGNGIVRWCSELSSINGHDEFNSINSEGNTLYADTYNRQMMAFRAQSGSLLWRNNFATTDTTHLPPTVVDNVVYGGAFGIYALNAQDGGIRWHYFLAPHIGVRTAPVVMNGAIYFGTHGRSDQIIALDAATGKERWIFPLQYEGTGELAVGDGMIIFVDSKYSSKATWLDGVDAQNGKLIWRKSFLPDISVSAAPLEVNNTIYISGSLLPNDESFYPSLYALNVRTGGVEWSKRVGVVPSLAHNNILYGANGLGQIIAIDPLGGQTLWKAQLHVPSIIGSATQVSLLNNELFIGIESIDTRATFVLHAFNLSTHEEDWYANITGTGTSLESTISVAVE